MSTSGKIPVVVLEMMEKLRREQKAKEQSGKNGKKTIPGKNPNENSAHLKDSNELFGQNNKDHKASNSQQVLSAPVRTLNSHQESVQRSRFHNPLENQTLRYQAPINQAPRYQGPTNIHAPKYQDPSIKYPDPPVEELQPHVVHMTPKPMSPPSYNRSQYYMNPMLPTFPEAFHMSSEHLHLEPHHMIPHNHSHMQPNYVQPCAPYSCSMLPHSEYHSCAQGPVCHVTPYMGPQPSCCLDLNPCSPPTLPRMRRQASYMQMPLTLKPPQKPLSGT